jgi:uncharacterized protein YndB with AHSA1/START domain
LLTIKNNEMETITNTTTKITVESTVNAPVEMVWKSWTGPDHIVKWNHASEDWHCPKAENDLNPGGSFNIRMEAIDGSFGFDFGGVYDQVKKNELIEYTLGNGRKVQVHFSVEGDKTKVIETFDAETENSIELQKGGWQAILDNFKKYTESLEN